MSQRGPATQALTATQPGGYGTQGFLGTQSFGGMSQVGLKSLFTMPLSCLWRSPCFDQACACDLAKARNDAASWAFRYLTHAAKNGACVPSQRRDKRRRCII